MLKYHLYLYFREYIQVPDVSESDMTVDSPDVSLLKQGLWYAYTPVTSQYGLLGKGEPGITGREDMAKYLSCRC